MVRKIVQKNNRDLGGDIHKSLAALFIIMVFVITGASALWVMGEYPTKAAGKVKISQSKANIYVGDTLELKLKNSSGAVSWASSKVKIASVSSEGIVNAKKAGKANIVATYKGKAYTCKLTVKKRKELKPKQIFEKIKDSVVALHVSKDEGKYTDGTGFFIEESTLVTNFHVIDGVQSMYITTYSDGKKYEVTDILGVSPKLDIAILRVDYKGKKMARNSHKVSTGDEVYTYGSSEGLNGTFAPGYITNSNQLYLGSYYIQTNAPISHGSSGGPLINKYAEVIGITARHEDGQNLNFAIPIDQIDNVDISCPMTVEEYVKKENSIEKSLDLIRQYLTEKGKYNENKKYYFDYTWVQPSKNDKKYDFYMEYFEGYNWPIQFFLCDVYDGSNMELQLIWNANDSVYELFAYTEGKLGKIQCHIDSHTFNGKISDGDIIEYIEDKSVSKEKFIKETNSLLQKFKAVLDYYLDKYLNGMTINDIGFKIWD